MAEYKQCPNGHYYQGDHCPYCKTGASPASNTSSKTEVFGGFDGQQATADMNNFGGGAEKTTILDGATIVSSQGMAGGAPMGGAPMGGSRTVFGDEDEVDTVATLGGGEKQQRVNREARKRVGW